MTAAQIMMTCVDILTAVVTALSVFSVGIVGRVMMFNIMQAIIIKCTADRNMSGESVER